VVVLGNLFKIKNRINEGEKREKKQI
jgi:hypothetical protein